MRKPIVIIGGMGPQASLKLHELLLLKSRLHHSGNNDDYPYIVHFSVPVPDFIGDEERKKQAITLLQSLSKTVKDLQPLQVMLACNTAHLVADEIDYLHSSAFISMIEVTAAGLARDGVKRVGLMASPTTIRTKLYEKALTRQGIAAIKPNELQQQQIEGAIRTVLAGNSSPAKEHELLATADSLVSAGAEAILLGCTELPLIFPKEKASMSVYDSLDLYADAVITQYYLYNGVQK